MAPFYGWGSSASRLEALRGGSFLFKTSFKRLAIFVSFLRNFDPHIPTYNSDKKYLEQRKEITK